MLIFSILNFFFQDKNKKLRPLYDIPYMFEAREFLRKKLIGKKVSDELAFVSIWSWSHALGVVILKEVLSRLFSRRRYSRPSLVELLCYEERRVYVSGSGVLWERFKIGALTIV